MSYCEPGCNCSRCKEAFEREAANQERNKAREISIFVRNAEQRAARICGVSRLYKYDGDCKPVSAECDRIKGHNGQHRARVAGDKVFWK